MNYIKTSHYKRFCCSFKMVTKKFISILQNFDIMAQDMKDINYFIRRMVDNATEKVAQRYNSPTTEPRNSNISAKVMTPEEKIIIDAANGLYGIAGKVAVYIARSKHPREIGIYMPESDVITQTAPYLAETRRWEAENNPARTSAVIGQPKNQKSNEPGQERYAPRYRKYIGPIYSVKSKASKVYNNIAEAVSKIFLRLRQGKVYVPESQRSADVGYNKNKAVVLAFRNKNPQQSPNPNIFASQETIDDRVRDYKLPKAS